MSVRLTDQVSLNRKGLSTIMLLTDGRTEKVIIEKLRIKKTLTLMTHASRRNFDMSYSNSIIYNFLIKPHR